MNLENWQKMMVASIYNGNANVDVINANLNTEKKLNPRLGIEIYQSNSLQALLSSLKKTFPLCYRYMGDELFYSLGRRYVDCYPCEVGGLDSYGSCFPLFLDGYSDRDIYVLGSKKIVNFLCFSVVAKCEWYVQESHYAPDRNSFPFEELAALSPEQYDKVILHLSKDCFLLDSHYELDSIWRFLGDDKNHDCLSSLSKRLDEKKCFLVYRDEYKPKVLQLSEQEFSLLFSIQKSMLMQEVLEELVDDSLSLIPSLISRGWVDSFSIAKTEKEVY